MIDIPKIELQTITEAREISSIDLGQSRNAGQNTMSLVLLRRVVWKIFHQQRSASNDRHFATHDIAQLRELIETSHSHEAPHLRHSLDVRLKFAIGISIVVDI